MEEGGGQDIMALSLSLGLGSWKEVPSAPSPSLELLYANPGGPVHWNMKVRFQNIPLLGFVIWAVVWRDSPENYGGLWRKCLLGDFPRLATHWSLSPVVIQAVWWSGWGSDGVTLSHPTHVTCGLFCHKELRALSWGFHSSFNQPTLID